MEFLKTATQHSHLGYPLIVFYLVALVGFVLVIFRSHWALLFSLFCLAALNFHTEVFTRAPFFGPYLNLNNLLLWIALFAMLGECLRTRRQIWAPKISDGYLVSKLGLAEELVIMSHTMISKIFYAI